MVEVTALGTDGGAILGLVDLFIRRLGKNKRVKSHGVQLKYIFNIYLHVDVETLTQSSMTVAVIITVPG